VEPAFRVAFVEGSIDHGDAVSRLSITGDDVLHSSRDERCDGIRRSTSHRPMLSPRQGRLSA
jgi:hypothetical protein